MSILLLSKRSKLGRVVSALTRIYFLLAVQVSFRSCWVAIIVLGEYSYEDMIPLQETKSLGTT